MKITLISPFYEDFPDATNHFPLFLLPLQYVATPQPQSQYESIKIDITKQKSCKFYNLGQPKHSIQPINSEYQNYASALCGFLPICLLNSEYQNYAAALCGFLPVCLLCSVPWP